MKGKRLIEKNYKKIFFAVIIIKFILIYIFPITSDEAYYITWCRDLSLNYYDHPPITGWLLYFLSFFGKHAFFYRILSVLSSIIVFWGLFFVIKDIFKNKEKAILVSLAFLVSPINIFFIFITSDVPLLIFHFLSGVFFFSGLKKNMNALFFVSGIFLGLAVLSKYFSGLLLIGFVSYLLYKRDKFALKRFLIFLSGSVPIVLLHLYWNYNSCWTNLMFNVFNRHQNKNIEVLGILIFVLIQIYLITPWFFYYLLKNVNKVKEGIKKDNNIFSFLFLIPVIILGCISFFNMGFHFVLSFYPFLFFLVIYLNTSELRKVIHYSIIFSMIHLVLFVILMGIPIEKFKFIDEYSYIVLGKHGKEVNSVIEPYKDEYTMGAIDYSSASLMEYHSGHKFIVFGSDSRYGRNDDKFTDMCEFNGKNILILSPEEIDKDDYDDYFSKIKMVSFKIKNADFYLILGEGFLFKKYRGKILKKILKKYYTIPRFLPVGDCFFHNMYFPDDYNETK